MPNNPQAGDVHVNRPLTNISVAYMQDAANFVAAKVFPNVPVDKQSDRYFVYDRAAFNRDEMKERAEGGESAGGQYTVDSTPSYYAPVYAFHHDVSDQRRANTDNPLDPDRAATYLVTNKALIKREKLWVAAFFTAGVWANEDTGVASNAGAGEFLQWNDADSNPIKQIRDAGSAVLEATGFEPNTLVLGKRVFDALIDHPDIVDRVKYGNTPGGPATIDTAELSALFKLPNIYVMKAVENTAAEGVAEASSFIGGRNALLCYAAPAPALEVPSAGYTFSWTGYTGAAAEGQRIKRFRMENLAADRIEIEIAFAMKRVASDLGYFLAGAVA